MNTFLLTGTVSKAVEIKKSKNGKDYAIINIVVDPRFKDSKYKEEARIVCFYEKAKEAEKEITVGSRVQLEGFLKFSNGVPSLVLLNYFVDPYFKEKEEDREETIPIEDISPFEDDF